MHTHAHTHTHTADIQIAMLGDERATEDESGDFIDLTAKGLHQARQQLAEQGAGGGGVGGSYSTIHSCSGDSSNLGAGKDGDDGGEKEGAEASVRELLCEEDGESMGTSANHTHHTIYRSSRSVAYHQHHIDLIIAPSSHCVGCCVSQVI